MENYFRKKLSVLNENFVVHLHWMNDSLDDVERENVILDCFDEKSVGLVRVQLTINQYLREVDQFVRDEDEYVPSKKKC